MMSILSWIRRKFRATEPQGRALPTPIRVRLSDHQVHDDYFVRLKEWSEFHPVSASWVLPERIDQELRYEAMILAAVRAGGVDGLVPDMLDRLIHEELNQVREQVEQEHARAEKQLTYYHEQAKLAMTQLWQTIAPQRAALAEAQAGYIVAFEELTGYPPAVPSEAVDPTPVIIPTQVAPREVAWDPAPEPGEVPLPGPDVKRLPSSVGVINSASIER